MTNDIKKIIFLFLGFWVVIGFGGFLVWNLNKAEWDSQNQQKIK